MGFLLWLLPLLTLLIFALGFSMAAYAVRIDRQTLAQARRWQQEHYDISWYDALEKTDETVESGDGYRLHVQFLRNPAAQGRYMILSHGYTDNRYGSLKYARIYWTLGFHVILYDLRGHGENDKTFCTYSIRESKDLAALIAWCRKRFSDVRTLGLHGESLGAATAVACLKYHPAVDFAVADCPFSEIGSVLKGGLKQMHLPPALVHLASLCARIRYGYWFHEMRPIDSLAGNKTPLLFLHGEADSFIPPRHSERMAEAAGRELAQVRLFPGAGHAASVLTDPAGYEQAVRSFLERIGAIGKEGETPCD